MSFARRFRPIIMLAVLACTACAATPATPSSAPSVTLRGQRFSVEVMTTPDERAHGLMGRASMPADHGMLFVFPDAEPRTFWMKNTLFPEDMLFFDSTRRLVTILSNVPPCKADPCANYPSGAPARYVLELNAGTAAKLGVRKGDVITFSNLPSGTQ